MYNNDSFGKKIESDPGIINYFKDFSFYNKYIEKAKIKCLKNIDVLSELLFYEQLNVIKKDCAIKGYAMNYKVN